MAAAPDVTDAELAIMKRLWEDGPSTVRQLLDRLYAGGGASAHATVQKLLERLESKGCVERDRSGHVQVFKSLIDRDRLVDRRIRAVADDLCGGSLAAVFSHFVEARGMPEKERRILREFLARLDRESRDGSA
jgi:predicted transcriptional regulator